MTDVTGAAGDLVVSRTPRRPATTKLNVPITSALNLAKNQMAPNLTFVTPGIGGAEDYNRISGNCSWSSMSWATS